jgi:hypothetical protein
VKQQLQVSSETDALTLEVWDHTRLLVPSSGTINISLDNVEEVSASSITVSADGVCSYIPGTAVTADYQENGRAEWTLNFDGYSARYVQLFDIVQYPILSQITDEDLISECSELQGQKYMAHGTADSGSASSLVDSELVEYEDDHWKGGTVEIVAGTNAGEWRVISTSDRETGTLTVSTSFTVSITATSEYVVRRTFQREIDRAFEDMCSDVSARGYRPALIISSDDLKPAHAFLTLSKVCRNLSQNPDDIWWKRADLYAEKYSGSMSAMKWLYDSDEDEEPDVVVSGIVRLRR